MARFISPNDLHEEAKKYACEGREPSDHREWSLIVNYWAVNIMPDHAESICTFLGKIYNCPLDEQTIREIAQFQVKRKKHGKS